MGYFNRLSLLAHTLKTISQTTCNDFEVIVVDDYSDPQHSPHALASQYSFVKVINMSDEIAPRNYINPCVVYNTGFKYASGDKIIIQNPECCHVGDVLSFVSSNLTNNNYLTFHCFAADTYSTNRLHTTTEPVQMSGGWYNHVNYRPVGYHFCSAITRQSLNQLNGFDERYRDGFCYDDDEFFHRVKLSGLAVRFVESPFVVHQDHSTMPGRAVPMPPGSFEKNQALFMNITMTENKIRADKGIIQ